MRSRFIKPGMGRRAKVIAIVLMQLVLWSLFVTSSGFAQLRSLDVSQYLHTSWTAQEGYFRGIGISNHAIAQTGDGYIWIVSSTGVLRFDGVRFVAWKPPLDGFFPGNSSSQLLASRDGSLWIAGHGVVQIASDGSWHTYHELDTLDRVRLAEDKDGVMWAGAETSPSPNGLSLFRIDHGRVAPYNRPELVGLGFTPLFADGEGRLWADSERGIWQILPGPPKLVQKKTLRSSVLSEDSAGALLYAQAGRIWKLSAKGTSKDYLRVLEGNTINTILRDKEGGLWVGTYGQGIFHLHEGRLDHFSSMDGLSSDIVESIFQDREGNVWATSPESIDKFTKPAVPRLTRKQGLSGDSVFSVLTDYHKNSWIGTANGVSEIVADGEIKQSTKFRNNPALALVETHSGRVLIATSERDKTMARAYGRLLPDASGSVWLEGYQNVFSLAEDADSTLWATSQELGLLHLRENGELIKAFGNDEPGNYPLSVAFDPKRNGIWFTTHNGTVFFLKDGKILERYGRADGLKGGRILRVDDDGGVWIAEQTGLAYLIGHKVSILGIRNGLPCSKVHWMWHDQDHDVWLYTECGLVSFSERDLSSWSAEPSHSITIKDYLDNTEGVENTAIGGWYTPQSAMTNDGRILFAMRTGLGVLDPRHLNQNALPPPVYVEGLTADGHEVGNAGRASLPAKTGTIHIAYTALSFAAPRKVQFRYKLEGYDADWSTPILERGVTYTNLPPGDYSFRVKACNNSGIWNEQGATVQFTILPAFYQTRWFSTLSATVLIGLIWLGARWRMMRLTSAIQERAEVRADERVRIARDLHDTLLQGIQGLMLHFHVATQELPDGSHPRERMERALATADRMIVEGRNRVNRLRSERFTLKDLIGAFKTIAADLNHEQLVRFTLTIEGSKENVSSTVLNELCYIGREAINNAFRHASASDIAVRLMCGTKSVVLVITDNGRGFDLITQEINPRAGHWGLRGMRERADVIGAKFECNSSPGKGTQVAVAVSSSRAYEKDSSEGRGPGDSFSPDSTTV